MKVTIYTVSDCKFSQEEKTYLQSNGIQFEEKNLESNRDYLTEMLQKSSNFAGTPVTEIVKDDGTTAVIKGFTQSEFDAALGMSGATPAMQPAQDSTPVTQEPQPETPITPTPPVVDEPAAPVTPPVSEPVPTIPPNEPQAMPQMNEAASTMSIPDPAPLTPVSDTTEADTAAQGVSAGQILSDNLSAPVTTQSMTPGTPQSLSATPPAPTEVAAADITAGVGVNPNVGNGSMPLTDPSAIQPPLTEPVSPPAPQTPDPLNSVLNDLQAKANS